MTSRRRRGELREQILDVADALLFDHGAAQEVSIDAVVEAVGCTPPALYYYFDSKEELLLEVCKRQYARFAEEMEASLPPDQDPLAELIARGHAYLDWAVIHPEHYRILFMTTTGAPQETGDDQARNAAGLAQLIDNIERAIGAGRLPPGDSLQMALVLWSAVHGITSIAVANPGLPREYAHSVVQFTANAVLAAFGAVD